MRILHINAADFGSTGKIVSDISRFAKSKGHESFLITPIITQKSDVLTKIRTSVKYEQGLYRRIAKILGYDYGFAPISTVRILFNIKKIKPNVVHLHSINSNMVNIYTLVKFLKKHHIPTVVTNHAEFFYTGSCANAYQCEKWKTGCGGCENYKITRRTFRDTSAKAWEKMKNAFSGFNEAFVTSVSPYIYSRSAQSPIFDGIEQKTVPNGINTEVFYPRPKIDDDVKKSFKNKTVLFVTAAFDPIDFDGKGGGYIVELARRFEKDNVDFVVLGRNIKREIELPQNLSVLGNISNQDKLAQYYSAADLCVITSKCETFSMPVAESLACGTPIVGFKAGGPESISIDEFSEFVDYGDIDSLERIVREKWLNAKQRLSGDEISKAAKEKYSYNKMAEEFLNIYKVVIERNENRNPNLS